MSRPNYATPFVELFRELTEAERAELVASIRTVGVLTPVLVYHSERHGDAIIDGVNRWQVAAELGVPCPVNDLGTMSDDDARSIVEQCNLARRHLSPGDWKTMAKKRAERIKRVAEKRKEGKSLRTIAGEEGVDEKTVRKDLEEAGSGADGSAPEPAGRKVKGKDGKTYPNKQTGKTSGADGSAPEPVIEPPPDNFAHTEQSGSDDDEYASLIDDEPGLELSHADPLFGTSDPPKPTPRPSLPGTADHTEYSLIAKEGVAKYGRFRKWVLAMGRMSAEFSDLMKGPGTYYLRNLMANGEPMLAEVSKDARTAAGVRREKVWVYPPLEKFITFVKNALPHKVCAACRGHGMDHTGRTCVACGAVGYLPAVPLPPPESAHLPFTAADPWDVDDLPEE